MLCARINSLRIKIVFSLITLIMLILRFYFLQIVFVKVSMPYRYQDDYQLVLSEKWRAEE